MPNELVIRRMTGDDIPAGMRLRELAGWNQTERDWKRFLEMEPEGCFVAELDGRVCATVTTLNYERRFGWVSMVLVDPDQRRLGIGTRMLEQGIAYLDSAGVETVKLDATPMGRPVYLPRGFVDEYGIERWEGVAGTVRGTGLAPMTYGAMQRVCEWDRQVFGADRTRLLEQIWREEPRYSAVIYAGSEITGYVLGRQGARAHFLGPWVASDPASGERLFREFLSRVPGERLFVDICLPSPQAQAFVKGAGFAFQRPLTRMYRGPNRCPGVPQHVLGIAGPELG